MSTRSAPSTLSAVVLVSQPVTASTWPVSSGVMSAPIGDDGDVLLGDLVLRQQRAQQDHAGGLDADLLADHVLRAADRVLLQREEAVRVLLDADREALDRQALRHRQHQRRARRHLAAARSGPTPRRPRRRCWGRRAGSGSRCLPARSSPACLATTSPSWLPPISQPSCMLILVLPAARAPIDSRLPPAIRPAALSEDVTTRRRARLNCSVISRSPSERVGKSHSVGPGAISQVEFLAIPGAKIRSPCLAVEVVDGI